jgi:hypothetical protein
MGAREGGYRQEVEQALRTRCLHLLTKEAYTGLPEANETRPPVGEAAFWCDLSGEALGPDGSQVCPRACGRPGRSCYEPPARL